MLQKKKNNNKILIRTAKTSDAGEVASLSGQLGYPVTEKEMRGWIRIVGSRKNQTLYVAIVDGTLAGWLEVFVPPSVLNWGKAEIGALIVDGSRRGMGIGRALLEAARNWARKRGSRFIYLRSNVKRKSAHAFYRKSGYKVFKTQRVFKLLLH